MAARSLALAVLGAAAASACIAPGQCTPPATTYSRVIAGPKPGLQWNIAGGFCGAFSVQHGALAFGAWISQDLVRKSNRDQAGPHHMHGDTTVGFEVMPSNVAYTANALRLTFDEWDSSQPTPQAPLYKQWLKKHLSRGEPVVWFPICKGDSHDCYEDACPNGGTCDHVEPMYGLFSNHDLDDPVVYDDDWILHASDQDVLPYYRRINSLDDTLAMDGNCANAQPGFGKNEMYPCFVSSLTYGLAVTGLNITGTFPVALMTGGAVSEPDTRQGTPPSALSGSVIVSGLTAGQSYLLLRYNGTATLPAGPPFVGYAIRTPFTASNSTWSYDDPATFLSNTATYYIAVAAS